MNSNVAINKIDKNVVVDDSGLTDDEAIAILDSISVEAQGLSKEEFYDEEANKFYEEAYFKSTGHRLNE